MAIVEQFELFRERPERLGAFASTISPALYYILDVRHCAGSGRFGMSDVPWA
ncbi:MAG: hypothetical protein JO128_23340 [Alphaproteobacteria bacterium]|nr:hypothetical protein [Alphaproteobacteria bacterium]